MPVELFASVVTCTTKLVFTARFAVGVIVTVFVVESYEFVVDVATPGAPFTSVESLTTAVFVTEFAPLVLTASIATENTSLIGAFGACDWLPACGWDV